MELKNDYNTLMKVVSFDATIEELFNKKKTSCSDGLGLNSELRGVQQEMQIPVYLAKT